MGRPRVRCELSEAQLRLGTGSLPEFSAERQGEGGRDSTPVKQPGEKGRQDVGRASPATAIVSLGTRSSQRKISPTL